MAAIHSAAWLMEEKHARRPLSIRRKSFITLFGDHEPGNVDGKTSLQRKGNLSSVEGRANLSPPILNRTDHFENTNCMPSRLAPNAPRTKRLTRFYRHFMVPCMCHFTDILVPLVCHFTDILVPRICRFTDILVPRICHFTDILEPRICHFTDILVPRICHFTDIL